MWVSSYTPFHADGVFSQVGGLQNGLHLPWLNHRVSICMYISAFDSPTSIPPCLVE